MTVESFLLWIAGAFIALRVIAFSLTFFACARLRLVAHAYTACGPEEIPAPVLPLFQRAARELEALGFEAHGFALLSPVVEGDAAPSPYLMLRHRDRRSWALVFAAATPTHSALLDLALVSNFADGTSLTTLGGQKFSLPFEVPGQRVIDHYRLRWEELVRDHLQELAQSPQAPLEHEYAEFLSHSNQKAVDALACLTRLAPGGAYVLPWRQVFKTALRALSAGSQLQRFQRERLKAPAWAPELPEAQLWVEARALRIMELVRSHPVRPALLWATFALTAALFAVSMAVYGSTSFVAQITLVVLIHELGHWLAMRATGYDQPSIFFIPFFGAATAGRKPNASLWQELFVLLAGPVPGIVLGALALVLMDAMSPALHELATLAVIVNAVNLLPLGPLDGGRIVHRLMLRDRPKLELAMTLGSAALFGFWAYKVSEPVLALLTVSLLITARSKLRIGQYAQQLRRQGPTTHEDPVIPVLRVTADRQVSFAQRALLVRGVTERLSSPESSALQRRLGSAGYAAVVAATLGVMGQTLASGRLKERSLACADVLSAESALAGVAEVGYGVTCEPNAGQAVDSLLEAFSAFSELPGGLCLQGPWDPAALSSDQLRARDTVRELEQTFDAVAFSGPDESTPEQEAALRAQALAAAEAKSKERAQLPGFDAAASAAYLAYRRTSRRTAPEKRALEELLGRGAACPARTLVFAASVGPAGELHLGSARDPRPLIHHLCKAGCRTVSWRAR